MEINNDIINDLLDEILPADLEYKNSLDYASKDWRQAHDIDVTLPVQRRLANNELVFDFDHITDDTANILCNFCEGADIKYFAWKSGPEGLHIHMWLNYSYSLELRKRIVEVLSQNITAFSGVQNDINPMRQGVIRAEWSVHPEKGYQKIPFRYNLNHLFYKNPVPSEILVKAQAAQEEICTTSGRTGPRDGKVPTCMKYILSHMFADGRQRLLFAVTSWYKSQAPELNRDAAISKIMAWAQKQGVHNLWQVPYMYDASEARCGCTYRHSVLEELGVDMPKCRWEK